MYLPEGSWTDFWTGVVIKGPVWLKDTVSSLDKIPVYVKTGAEIRVYPEIVQSTKEMDFSKAAYIRFDSSYTGFSKSVLGRIIEL